MRDYIHVADLAQTHVQALGYLAARGPSTILNLGAETGHSIRDVIAEVEKVSGRRVPVKMAPRRVGDAPILVASCAKARSVLGWQQRWSDLPGIVRHAPELVFVARSKLKRVKE